MLFAVVFVTTVLASAVKRVVVATGVSHPLHVLSHSPEALVHKPSDKMTWQSCNDSLLCLFVHRCGVLELALVTLALPFTVAEFST